MSKILYFITKSNWGGAQRYIYDLATNLNKLSESNTNIIDYDIKIYAGLSGNSNILFEKIEEFNSKSEKTYNIDKNNSMVAACGRHHGIVEEKPKAKKSIKNKIETKRLNLHNDFNILKSIKNLFEFYKILKDEAPDVIHVNSSKISIMICLVANVRNFVSSFSKKGKKIKIIFTAHGWPHSETHRSILFRLFTQAMMIITVILSHKTICVSQATKDALLTNSLLGNAFLNNLFKKYLNKKIKVIYNGMYNIDKNDQKIVLPKLRETIDSPHYGKINLVSIGEYHPNKGHDTVIKYINELDNVHYHIIGSGIWQSHLENLIQNTSYDQKEKNNKIINVSDKVSLLHIPHNAAHVLSRYDIFLMPSRKEGFAYTIPEALYAGLPVIARDVGGARELINTTPTLALPQGEGITPTHPIPPAPFPQPSPRLWPTQQGKENIYPALTLYNDDYELIEILKNFKKETLVNYHEWIDERFSVEHMVKETVELYR